VPSFFSFEVPFFVFGVRLFGRTVVLITAIGGQFGTELSQVRLGPDCMSMK
jgi:hypothetical protein